MRIKRPKWILKELAKERQWERSREKCVQDEMKKILRAIKAK